MSSIERLNDTLNHIQPDREPIDLDFAPELCQKLQDALGLNQQQLDEWVGNDLVFVGPVFRNPASQIRYADPTIEITADGHYLDIYHVPFKQVQTEFQAYIDLAGEPPLQHCSSRQELDDHPWPTTDLWGYSNIPCDLNVNQHKATWGHSRGFFEIAHFMRGMEEFMMDLALDPEFACCLMDHIASYLLKKARIILDEAQGRLTIFEYNDDVASQTCLFMSPDMWRLYNKPRMAKFCELIHSHGAKVKYHSCGSVRAIIPDLIEIGVDILNPVQPLATGMNPFELKREFGNHITFHGGMDIQDFLIHATPVEVREHTRKMIDIVGKDGGFILSGSHTLQADTPVENVIALIEEAKR